MCLDQVYLRPGTRERLRAGPMGWVLEEFARWLQQQGSALRTIQEHVTRIGRLCRRSKHTDGKVSAEQVSAMLRKLETLSSRGASRRERRRRKSSLGRFREYLEAKGLAEPQTAAPQPYDPVLRAYEQWLRDVQASCPATIALRSRYAVAFMTTVEQAASFQGLRHLDVNAVRTYAVRNTQGLGKSHRRSIYSTLRSFLRFCFCQRHTGRDLSTCVPSVRSYTLAETPRGLSDEQAQAVLSAVDRSTPIGIRDYAILQLLYTYGVRGAQVRLLRLEDIDWRKECVLFQPVKRGKRSILPMTEDVGNSLLDYLQRGRPETAYRQVFVTFRAPFRPLVRAQALSSIVGKWIRRAGIDAVSCGAHGFRHCFASRMVQRGHSLKSVADIVGHRQLATTFIYTKVDFPSLQKVAMDWPEVQA